MSRKVYDVNAIMSSKATQTDDKVKETHGMNSTKCYGLLSRFSVAVTVYKKSVILLLTQNEPTVEYDIIARIRNYIQFT